MMITAMAHAQSVYIATGAKAHFFSETVLENIDAKSESMTSVLSITTNEIQFSVPLRTFKFEKSLMEEHFNEKYVESETYPKTSFKGKLNETIDWTKDTLMIVTATGDLNLHGVTKTITEQGKLTIKKGTIRIETAFTIALKDYNILVPKVVSQSVAENIKVDVDCNYMPYVKKK